MPAGRWRSSREWRDLWAPARPTSARPTRAAVPAPRPGAAARRRSRRLGRVLAPHFVVKASSGTPFTRPLRERIHPRGGYAGTEEATSQDRAVPLHPPNWEPGGLAASPGERGARLAPQPGPPLWIYRGCDVRLCG